MSACSYIHCNRCGFCSNQGDAGRVQLTAGHHADELAPAAKPVALVAGLALSAAFIVMIKPSLSSPAMPPKADMLDSLHGVLVRDQYSMVCYV